MNGELSDRPRTLWKRFGFKNLLVWLLVYLLVIKNQLIGIRLTIVHILVLVALNLVIILCSRFLQPVFDGVLNVTQRIGTLIFGLITAVVALVWAPAAIPFLEMTSAGTRLVVAVAEGCGEIPLAIS